MRTRQRARLTIILVADGVRRRIRAISGLPWTILRPGGPAEWEHAGDERALDRRPRLGDGRAGRLIGAGGWHWEVGRKDEAYTLSYERAMES